MGVFEIQIIKFGSESILIVTAEFYSLDFKLSNVLLNDELYNINCRTSL